MEASGTSGMKAAVNGVPHVSLLDGWWLEGYDGNKGWRFGSEDTLCFGKKADTLRLVRPARVLRKPGGPGPAWRLKICL